MHSAQASVWPRRNGTVDSAEGAQGRKGFLRGQINRWWIVLGCALVNIVSAGIFMLYAVNIFFVGAGAEYGWPKSTISFLLSIFFFSSGLGLIGLGWAIGRYGTRLPSVSLAVGYGVCTIALAFLPPSKLIFGVDFFLIGIFGAAACALPFSIAISGYFDSHRGLALGIGAAGAGLGSAVTATVSNMLLEHFGWRHGLAAFCTFATFVVLFSLTVLLRTPPGAVARKSAAKGGKGGAALGQDYRDLLSRELLIIVAVLGLNALCAVGIIANLVPLFGERGVSTAMAASIISTAGLSSWGGRILIGWLLDRFFAPYVACSTFALGAAGTLLLVYCGAGPLSYLGAIMIGLCIGAEQDLAMYLASRYFPLSAYSKAVSLSWLAWAWGGGAGTYIAAQSYALTRNYQAALWIFISMFAAAGILVLRLPAYRYEKGMAAGEATRP